MAKLLNILALVYLGIAPGMNVDNLLHSVSLCHFAESVAVTQVEPACAHDEHDEPEDHAPREHGPCDHVHQLSPDAGAMPVSSVAAQTGPSAALKPVVVVTATHLCKMLAPAPDIRPPPGNPHVGITLLLI